MTAPGGVDSVFDGRLCGDVGFVIGFFRGFWKDVVFEIEEENNKTEIFVYKSALYLDSWNAHGLTDYNDTGMLYLTFEPDAIAIVSGEKMEYERNSLFEALHAEQTRQLCGLEG